MDITPIIQAFIGLVATIVTCWLIPWIKAKTTAQQQENIRAVIKTLVYAAEQVYGAGKGEEKMHYVKDMLDARGYIVDIPMIEATVGEYLNSGKTE